MKKLLTCILFLFASTALSQTQHLHSGRYSEWRVEILKKAYSASDEHPSHPDTESLMVVSAIQARDESRQLTHSTYYFTEASRGRLSMSYSTYILLNGDCPFGKLHVTLSASGRKHQYPATCQYRHSKREKSIIVRLDEKDSYLMVSLMKFLADNAVSDINILYNGISESFSLKGADRALDAIIAPMIIR